MKVLLCDPFAYSEDYNRPLFAALRAAGSDAEYLTSENVHLPPEPEGAVPGRRFFFLRRSKRWLRDGRLPPALAKAAGAVEYFLDMGRLCRKASRERALVHLMWIKHPVIDGFWGLVLRLQGRLVYTMHNALPHDAETAFNKAAYALYYRLPCRVIALARPEIDRALALHRGLQARLIPHGLLFLDVPERSKPGARAALSWGTEKRVVLFWGNIVPYKGLDDLLAAFLRLRGPDYILAVAGKWSLPPGAKARWLGAARADGRVALFDGTLPPERVRDLLCGADLLILPYREATQSGVGFAALRYGLPMVVTSAGALPELLPEAARGRCVVPPRSPELLAEAISGFFARPPREREALAAGLRAYAADRYSWDGIALKTLEVYRSLEPRA